MNNRQDPRKRPQNQGQRRVLTPAERAERERRRRLAEQKRAEEERQLAREKAAKKARRKSAVKAFFGRALITAIVVVILAVIAAIVGVYLFNRAPDAPPESGKITYIYGGKEVREAPVDQVVDGNLVYFCFGDLADYLGFAEQGDSDSLKYVIPGSADTSAGNGDEEYIKFDNDGHGVEINGQQVRLSIPNKLGGRDVWVTTEFVSHYIHGVTAVYNEDKLTVTISRLVDETASTEENLVYEEVSFVLRDNRPIEGVEEDPLVGDVPCTVEFKNDLTAYEQYMNPEGELRDAFLILVNTKNHLTENDIPPDLTDCIYTAAGGNMQQMRLYAAKALEAMFIEMRSEGFYNIAVRSGYRDYNKQAYLFEYYVNREMGRNSTLTREAAEKIVLTFSTRPGTSEHQTGLAVDMDNTGMLVTDFQYDPEYAWLSENAWKFGFILRFPADKTDITTISFEPWHYRYVGRYHAKRIHDAGMCLEEYVEALAD